MVRIDIIIAALKKTYQYLRLAINIKAFTILKVLMNIFPQ